MRLGELAALRKSDVGDDYIWVHRQQVVVFEDERCRNRHVDCNERCLVLGHSIQTNERNYSFRDLINAERVKETLNLNSGKSA